MNNLTHTIAAVSTPPGKGGVAIIRISGEGAFDIAEKVFNPLSKKALSEFQMREQIYGHITLKGEKIDDVLLTKFKAPHSYTGEDTVEIACHGGILVTSLVLEAVLSAGAVAATAGEFTRRAFINGRLSLTEAEAISDLLEAKTREQIRLSSDSSRSALSKKIGEIRTDLVGLMSSLYARIDYPDEDLGDFSDGELLTALYNIRNKISSLNATYKTAKAISEGIETVICGKPNAGKSSFYNMLVGEDAAIVTDIEGTTRDVLTRAVSLGKVVLNLADTAGIRESDNMDTVERIGIERSRKMIEKCELVFAIFDTSREFDEQDAEILRLAKETSAVKIAILNKADLSPLFAEDMLNGKFDYTVKISTKGNTDASVEAICDIVEKLFTDEKITIGTDAVISSARQSAALSRALEFVNAAVSALEAGFAQDAVSSDVERALGAISELDGRCVSEEIVADIFSKFCVGK